MHIKQGWYRIIKHSEQWEGWYEWKSEFAWQCVLKCSSDFKARHSTRRIYACFLYGLRLTFYFWDYRTTFVYHSPRQSLLSWYSFLIPATFHPRRWSLPSPRLTGLEVFEFGLWSSRSYPEQESRHSSPLARSVFSTFHFEGSANIWTPSLPIGTPKLVSLRICFFNQIDFDMPHLVQFIKGWGLSDEIWVVFNALGYHSLTSEGLTINENPVRRFELAALLSSKVLCFLLDSLSSCHGGEPLHPRLATLRTYYG